MLVAIFSLIAALLFGGNEMDYYMVSSLEKGMNKCIVDKNEKQEIKQVLKTSKSETKSFYKAQKQNTKELKKLLLSNKTTTKEFYTFEEKKIDELSAYQNKVFETRITCLKYITEQEWNCIIETAEKHTLKDIQKKSKSTKEDPFKKVKLVIEKEVASEINQKHLLKSVDKLENSYQELLEALQKRNEIDQAVISQYDSTIDDFKVIATEINSLRSDAFDQLVQFHHDASPLTSAEQWQSIAKQLNKVIMN
ncbi:hypothetical protein [Saccharicrinis aurantiacus]|uniref:hypothetical protein n=1 Tax=Saccharicrinis aurantiacus TaxID=1849719 RepID=UPI00094F8556|nr:hypothetical protein [Saccharicrinis aurantiacus]